MVAFQAGGQHITAWHFYNLLGMPTARAPSWAYVPSSVGLRVHGIVRLWHIVPLSKFNCFISPLIYSFVHLLSCLLNFSQHICGSDLSEASLHGLGFAQCFFVPVQCLFARNTLCISVLTELEQKPTVKSIWNIFIWQKMNGTLGTYSNNLNYKLVKKVPLFLCLSRGNVFSLPKICFALEA